MFLQGNPVVQNLGLTTEARNDVSQVIQALQRYVDGHINETVERRNFRRRIQQPGETFDDFLISLRELAKTCKFCSDTCKEKSIRNQIIEGSKDGCRKMTSHCLRQSLYAEAEKQQKSTVRVFILRTQ